MRPQDGPKPVHDPLHIAQLQLRLPLAAFLQIRLESVHAGVDLPVLLQQVHVTAELGHLARQHGEDALLLDLVVQVQLRDERETPVDELPDRHPRGPFVVGAGVVELVPGEAEMVMLVVLNMSYRVLIIIQYVQYQTDSLLLIYTPTLNAREKTYKLIHMLRHPIIHPELRGRQLWQRFVITCIILLLTCRLCC